MRRSPGSLPEGRRPRAGLIVAAAGLVVGFLAERASFDWDDPRRWVPDLVVGLTFIGTGAFAVRRRPGTGWLLAATGFAWFAGNFDSGLLYLHRGPLVHVIVAYVGWRPRSRLELSTIVIGYISALVAPVWDNDAVSIALVAGLVAVAAHSMRTATEEIAPSGARRSRPVSCSPSRSPGSSSSRGPCRRATRSNRWSSCTRQHCA